MSTRRPVPPAGEMPEPYPGDTEMLKRARIEKFERATSNEALEALEREAHEKEKAGAPLNSRRYNFINDNLMGVARTLADNLIMQAGLLSDVLENEKDAYTLAYNKKLDEVIDGIAYTRAALSDLVRAASRIKDVAIERGQA